ncbi:hypothetical protein FVE85_9242 [Porphyridium purpureum]|uniref:Uncharacterized protein n=1 Tax=Porphyridium purpureum TaxID=35688 RepID=A0A5J4YPS6_PORPP|nr:hypothetical protein FVE85_9242 [Porphyridium purpureum]|eukprot:POR4098..scf222_8
MAVRKRTRPEGGRGETQAAGTPQENAAKTQEQQARRVKARQAAASERQRQTMLQVLNVCMVAVFAYLATLYARAIRSNEADQPLTVLYEDFLPPDAFQQLQTCLANSSLLHGENVLNKRNFKGTYGFAVKFNNDGVQQFKDDPAMACLVPYFERAVRNDTNAWVVNVLVCEETQAEVSVGIHVDNTVGIHVPVLRFLAHVVDVLYVSIPRDMQGGSLVIWNYGSGPSIVAPTIDSADREIVPRENHRVSFRGDAFHTVRGFQIPEDVPKQDRLRISLVIEQYKIPSLFYRRTDTYRFQFKTNMTMV